MSGDLPYESSQRVGGRCLCLHTRRAARALSRRFDEAFRPLDLTNGQFSLLMALNRPSPWSIGELAEFLVMDRTSLTANLKPLARRDLISVRVDPADRRGRRIRLRAKGRRLLARALPIWEETHAEIEAGLARAEAEELRRDLRALAK